MTVMAIVIAVHTAIKRIQFLDVEVAKLLGGLDLVVLLIGIFA
jgi:hypothetical protein